MAKRLSLVQVTFKYTNAMNLTCEACTLTKSKGLHLSRSPNTFIIPNADCNSPLSDSSPQALCNASISHRVNLEADSASFDLVSSCTSGIFTCLLRWSLCAVFVFLLYL